LSTNDFANGVMSTELPVVARTISGKGVIEIPEDYGSALSIFLYTQLVRDVRSPSINLTYNPDRGFYANVCFCVDDFVLATFAVNYKQQAFEVFSGQPSQNLVSLICAYEGILDSFVQYASAFQIPYIKINRIFSHPYMRFVPNKIRFECFGSCALRLTLKGVELDKCAFEQGMSASPPPPPDALSEVPFDVPVVVSPAYDGDEDGGDTLPFPIDRSPSGSFPDGALLRVVVRADRPASNAFDIPFEGLVYAPIADNAIATCNSSGDVFSSAVGIFASGSQATGYIPGGLVFIAFGGASGGGDEAECYTNARIDSVEVVEAPNADF
jgi:hypothetical protein